jgi:glycerophosphoryl diester phosphodiesterase
MHDQDEAQRGHIAGKLQVMPAQPFTGVPVLCGHRGSGAGVVGGHRENTLASFLAAAASGLRWVEVDVRMTADRVLVARHDPAVEDGREVAELTAAETDELELLRFADLLEALPAEIGLDVDVKTSLQDASRPRAETTAALAAEQLAAAAGRRELLLTSFDPAALLVVRERRPELPVGLITWMRFPLEHAIPAAVHLGADVVLAHVGSFASDDAAAAVSVAHAAGLQLAVWCPEPAEVERFLAAGLDCLIVDAVPAAVLAAPVR